MTTRFGPGAFRLVLAALVFVSHVSRFNIGRTAVVVFFVLSGFWVTRMYDLRRSPSVITYFRDRLLRVWPLLAITTVLIVASSAIAGRAPHGSVVSTLVLLGLATRGYDIIGVSWSLDIEMQFYLALPLAVFTLARIDAALRPAMLIAATVIMTLIGALLREQCIFTMLAYAPAFVAGAAIWRRRWRPEPRTLAISLSSYAVLITALAATPELRWMVLKSGDLPWWFDLSQIAMCALLVPLVAWNVNQPSSSLDRHLGDISYPFYLVHYPVIAATTGVVASLALTKGIALGLSLTAALALYLIVDRSLERLRKGTLRWLPRPLSTDSAPGVLTQTARTV